MTLTVYQGKHNKNILILSTVLMGTKRSQVQSIIITTPSKVLMFLITWQGKVSSRRWPLQQFCNIIDLAVINSWILYKEAIGKNISRNKFFIRLILELQMKETETENSEDDSDPEVNILEKSNKRQCCAIKPKRNKTSKKCTKCKQFTCGTCTARTKICCD